jgi:hypothetical protein
MNNRSRRRYAERMRLLTNINKELAELAVSTTLLHAALQEPESEVDLDEIAANVLELTKQGVEEIDAREAKIQQLEAELAATREDLDTTLVALQKCQDELAERVVEAHNKKAPALQAAVAQGRETLKLLDSRTAGRREGAPE